MCWSGEASAALAVVGLSATGFAIHRREPLPLWICLGYFSSMEVLQAYTYSVIDQCSSPANQVATLLGYLHITFQPFFINALAMYFIPREVREKIQGWVYALCFGAAIITLIQLYPFDWAGRCDPARPLCGRTLCSISGNWHIAWSVPTNGIGNYLVQFDVPLVSSGLFGYMAAIFVLPLLYGSWRLTIWHLIFGPTVAGLLSSNQNERPAIWCLLSIGLLLIVIDSPLRRYLFVRRWPLWPGRRSTVPPDAAADEPPVAMADVRSSN